MECARWEETGLLFTSGELSNEEGTAFQDHLDQCETCRKEYEGYQELRSQFNPSKLLQAEPSERTSQEILRVCADGSKKITTSAPLFSSVLKKGLVSAVFLLAGFMGTGYFVFVMNEASDPQRIVEQATSSEDISTGSSVSPSMHAGSLKTASLNGQPDSSRDSSQGIDSRPFSEKVGNLNNGGVQAVGVEKE